MVNPSANQPGSQRRPVASAPTSVFGEIHPAKPTRPVLVGVEVLLAPERIAQLDRFLKRERWIKLRHLEDDALLAQEDGGTASLLARTVEPGGGSNTSLCHW